MKRALEGLKVIDMTNVVMGPAVTRMLADHGATVIKLESSVRPDGLRSLTPYRGAEEGPNRSGYFAMYNAGKLSLTVNMRKESGRAFFRKYLVPWADVIAEAYAAGILERWGLAYEDMRDIKQDIILLRSCLAGHTGPQKDLKGTGQITAALAGWYDLTGWPDSDPVGPYSAYSDFVSWNYALVAVLSALDYRRRTGKGQYIDQSLLESTIQFETPAILDYAVNGHVTTRMGNRDLAAAPHGVYRCSGDDRWCSVAVTNDDEWRRLCQAIGFPNLVNDARFADLLARKSHEDELDQIVESWTQGRTPEEVMRILQDARVPAGVVQNAEDLFSDPQLAHRGAFIVRDHPVIGPHNIYKTSFRLSETPGEPPSAAPVLGQDNEYVCKELLGLSEEELADWIAEEAIE